MVARGTRSLVRNGAIPFARHRPGIEPRPGRTEDFTNDARYPTSRAEERRVLDRVLRYTHGRPQRPKRADVYRFVSVPTPSHRLPMFSPPLTYATLSTDKYSQIYRILLPICTTLSKLPTIYQTPSLRTYIDAEYGSLEGLYLEILGDFFRHAFDGSGADNFFDAGSCIDGRLTSAWNWCAGLEKKAYFHVFLLTGEFMSLLIR